MNRPLIIDGKLHSPYFTFIKDAGRIGDTKLLRILEIDDYKPTEDINDSHHHLYIVRDGEWTHIVDDWSYTLWHSQLFLINIRKLASNYDVFSFMVGDSDFSFEIEYHRGGRLERHYVFDQPQFGNGEVRDDIGKKFEIESEIKLGEEPQNYLWRIANTLKISSNYSQKEISIFSKPYERNEVSISPWRHRLINRN